MDVALSALLELTLDPTTPPIHDQQQQTPLSLFEAINLGNLRAVLDALQDPLVDINALEDTDSRRTTLFCALISTEPSPSSSSPDRVAILKALLARPELSLYVLNNPMDCANGMTALGYACAFGATGQVLALLECPSILIDARDSCGVTPLMYAAREGRVEIVQHLLLRGARPEVQDNLWRSATEYAKEVPEVLWQLEGQLRRQRKSKYRASFSAVADSIESAVEEETAIPSPTSETSELVDNVFQSIVDAVVANDFLQVQSILEACLSSQRRLRRTSAVEPEPTIIINLLDANGYSAIHHAVMCRPPNMAIIELLYLAGADVNLLTSQGETALQVFARYGSCASGDAILGAENLKDFVSFFVHSLNASFAAADHHSGDTCLHVAARYALSADVLRALLLCDDTRVLRDTRNSEGLRPFDVAKAEFSSVFELVAAEERPDSVCTLRPNTTAPVVTQPILRTQTSYASIHSVVSMASVISDTIQGHEEVQVPRPSELSIDDAMKAARELLEELELANLERTLFLKPVLTSRRLQDVQSVDDAMHIERKALENLLMQVVQYWMACHSRLQEEISYMANDISKCRESAARLQRRAERKLRGTTGAGLGEMDQLSCWISMWENEAARQETPVPVLQPVVQVEQQPRRGRAFTAPASTPVPVLRELSPLALAVSSDIQPLAHKRSSDPPTPATPATPSLSSASTPSTPYASTTPSRASPETPLMLERSVFEDDEADHDEKPHGTATVYLQKKKRRLTNYIKTKLLKRNSGPLSPIDLPSIGSTLSLASTTGTSAPSATSRSRSNSPPQLLPPIQLAQERESCVIHPAERDEYVQFDTIRASRRHAMDCDRLWDSMTPFTSPTVPTYAPREHSISPTGSGHMSPRGALRNVPIVLSRVEQELDRIEDFLNGIRYQHETVRKDVDDSNQIIVDLISIQISRFSASSTSSSPFSSTTTLTTPLTPIASTTSTPPPVSALTYDAEEDLEKLRTYLMGGLENAVEGVINNLTQVFKWNALVRTSLKDLKHKIASDGAQSPF